MRPFLQRLKWLSQRRRKEDELREELEFHIEQEAEDRQAKGLAGDDAHRAALLELGNVTLVREDTRAMWGWVFVEQVAQDLRYALRTMAHNRVFTMMAVLSLALGIGANVAIYSFMDTLLLRSLPVSDPQSLAVLNWHLLSGNTRSTVVHSMHGSIHDDSGSGMEAGIFPYPAYEVLRDSSAKVFSSLFTYYPTRKVNVMVNGQAELASGEYVSGDYFSGLDVRPVAGRAIIPSDDVTGAAPVAVLGFAYAQRRYASAAGAAGQSILINNAPFAVAGVAPPGFFGVDPAAAPDFYVPVHADVPSAQGFARKPYFAQNEYWIEMMARLRPGVSLTQAHAALGPVFHQWVASTAQTDPERASLPALMVREGATGLDTLRRRYSKPLYILLAMASLILAIACANIANLLLARATARRREMAVRLSMGAGRFRVIRQLLTESVLLASIGGGIGVLFAVWGIRFLTLLLAEGGSTVTLHADLNWHVMGAAVALSVVTGLVFGLAPAIQSVQVDLMSFLRESLGADRRPRIRHSFFRFNLSQVLVVSQIAFSLLMLVGAGLFARTLSNLQAIQLGFNHQDLLLFRMNAKQAGHKDPEMHAFYSDLQQRFAAIPGVRQATLSDSALLGDGQSGVQVTPVGNTNPDPISPHVLMAGTQFFATMQIPLRAGRPIEEGDRPDSAPVAVVNDAYVKTFFGNENPLGRHVIVKRDAPLTDQDVEIVGVTANARYGELKGAFPPIVYFPFNQETYYPVDDVTFALRTSGDPLRYANAVRTIVHDADPRVPVTDIRTQAAQIDQMMNQEITFAKLCTAFAMLALAIACVGLYGTMAYGIARRTGEIGVRMALGAERGRIVRMVLRQVITMVAIGLTIGVAVTYAASHLVESFLYGIKPNDPLAVVAAIAVLIVAAVTAGYAPARRASRIDPMAALRHE